MYTVKALGRDVTYVTSPSVLIQCYYFVVISKPRAIQLMSEISKNSKKFYFPQIRLDMSVHMFTMDPRCVSILYGSWIELIRSDMSFPRS